MLRPFLFLLLLMLAPRASAQEWFWPGCAHGLGAAVGRVVTERDWDFTTPGEVAWTGTPVYTTNCIGYAPPRGSVTWFGVDLMPTYRHSYRALGQRLPLLLQAHFGRGFAMVGRQYLGVQVVSNGLAWGVGARYGIQPGYKGGGVRPGLTISVNMLAGIENDWQLMITRDQWRGFPKYRNEERKYGKVMLGYQIGPLTTVSAHVPVKKKTRWNHPAELSWRLGTTTFPWSRTLVQPTLLQELQIELPPHRTYSVNNRQMRTRVGISAGTTRRDGQFLPAGGASIFLYGVERGSSKTRFGFVVGPKGYWAPDIGMGWVW